MQAFTLPSPQGAALHGLLNLPEEPGPRPTVVLCHGFKGFMEWGFFPYLADLLAQRGFAAVRFNVSGGGMLPGEDRVSDPAAFRANTFSRERDEILAVLDAVASGRLPGLEGRVDPGRLGLLGHSRGGAGALLAASSEPWRERLRALVTWSAVSTFERFDEGQLTRWRKQGFLPVTNARTGQELEMGLELLDDFEAHREALDLSAAAGRRQAPWLILHGALDETVPVTEGHTLEAAAAVPRKLHVVESGNHTFGARHPFAGPTPALIEALNETQLWLRRHLA